VNGEAIYGSRPFSKMCERDSTVFYTRRGDNLYAIATHLNGNTLILRNIPRPGLLSQVKLLGCDKIIVHYYFAGSLYIRLGNLTHEDLSKTKGAWVFRISHYNK
jgi:hypothetical protein